MGMERLLATKHEVRDAIEDLLAGEPVDVQDTRAAGFSTKWADKEAGANAEIAEGTKSRSRCKWLPRISSLSAQDCRFSNPVLSGITRQI
jgi:hypothetical protein